MVKLMKPCNRDTSEQVQSTIMVVFETRSRWGSVPFSIFTLWNAEKIQNFDHELWFPNVIFAIYTKYVDWR